MITQTPIVHMAGRYAPCLAAALSAVLPAQSSVTAHCLNSSRCSQAAAGALNCSSSRSISSGKGADADDKLGRPTTPWVRQVISGVDLMRHPKYNKGEMLPNGAAAAAAVICCCSSSYCVSITALQQLDAELADQLH